MLRDDLLVGRYARRLGRLLDLAESEVRRNANDERFRFTAEMYRDRIADALHRFEARYPRDLVAAFKSLQDAGIFEIVTSCATHAFLPCFDAVYARAQIRIGAKHRANRLLEQLWAHAIDEKWLTTVELHDNIFRDVDYHDLAGPAT